MDEAEVSARCLLPGEQARLAKMREYDEPFEIESASSARLLRAIEQHGKQWTRGDRFYHILGNNDKASAVRHLMAAYRAVYPEMHSVGLGDGHNDAEFLAIVDTPLIVRSRFAGALKMAVPRAVVTHWPGPEGWNEAVLGILDERDEVKVQSRGQALGERYSIAR
jgi:mannosyl-3-phosphoglycerate phosphatase